MHTFCNTIPIPTFFTIVFTLVCSLSFHYSPQSRNVTYTVCIHAATVRLPILLIPSTRSITADDVKPREVSSVQLPEAHVHGHLYDLLLAPFQPRSQTFPSPRADSDLTYFPNLPMVRGIPTYSADQISSRQKRIRMPAGSTFLATPLSLQEFLQCTVHTESVVVLK